MEKLYESAARGDVEALRQLLQKDTFLLERVSYTTVNNTPLHIASLKGHLPYVEEILRVSPHLAEELDSQQSSPLHVASARGNVEVARRLVGAAPDMCLSRDSRGRNPVHVAAIKGRVELLEELVSRAPPAARQRVGRGLTAMHLCVEHGQLPALKVLVREVKELINAKNDDGDTILHMAVMGKKTETIKFLLSVGALEVNAQNHEGLTALEVLIQSRRDVRDSQIEKLLKNIGTLENNEQPLNKKQNDNSWESLMEKHGSWLDRKKSTLMVVASLIATMAFQIGVNPPGGAWQNDSSQNDSSEEDSSYTYEAGESVLMTTDPQDYVWFYIVNTTAFIASLSIILLLMSGLPMRRRLFVWILMVITWIAITAIALTYVLVILILMTPPEFEYTLAVKATVATIFVWIGLMALLLLVAHTIRMIKKLVTKARERGMIGPTSSAVGP